MKYLIIKISPQHIIRHFCNHESFTSILQGPWRITPRKISGVTHVLALYNGTIIAEYKMNEHVVVNNETGKMTIKVDTIPDSDLIGIILHYPTSNPASVITHDKMKQIMKGTVNYE